MYNVQTIASKKEIHCVEDAKQWSKINECYLTSPTAGTINLCRKGRKVMVTYSHYHSGASTITETLKFPDCATAIKEMYNYAQRIAKWE